MNTEKPENSALSPVISTSDIMVTPSIAMQDKFRKAGWVVI